MGRYTEPLRGDEVRRLVKAAVAAGAELEFVDHAKERMKERLMDEVDCANTLKGGWVDEKENELDQRRGWSYKVKTNRMWVVIRIDGVEELEGVELPEVLTVVSCGRNS